MDGRRPVGPARASTLSLTDAALRAWSPGATTHGATEGGMAGAGRDGGLAVPSRLGTYLLLVLVVIIWSSYPTVVKVALRDMPPFTLAALRCLLASALLLGLVAREGAGAGGPITRTDLPPLLVLGLAGIAGSTGTYYLAVALTSASNAVILTATTPVFVAVGGHLFFGERLGRRQWTGVACSAAGVLLTVTRGELRLFEAPPRLGDGLALVGQIGWAAYTLYGKRVLARLSPRVATAAAYLIGTAVLIPLAIVVAPAFPPARFGSLPAWSVVVFQGVLGTLSHVWYYRGVKSVGPAVTAMFMNLQPLLGVALATVVLRESVNAAQGLGACAILVGVWLTTRR